MASSVQKSYLGKNCFSDGWRKIGRLWMLSEQTYNIKLYCKDVSYKYIVIHRIDVQIKREGKSILIKNVSSSTSHKLWNWETLKIRDSSFFLSSTFIYETILIKKNMNANFKRRQIFCKIKYDLKGHLIISKLSFSAIYYLYNRLKLFKNVNIMKTQIFH